MDRLAARYVKIRDMKKEMEKEFEEKLKPLSDALAQISTAMLAKLHEEGATSSKTNYGTVYISTTTQSHITDFDALWDYVKSHDVPEVFQKRLTTSEVEGLNNANPTEPVPGVVIEKVQAVRVRAK